MLYFDTYISHIKYVHYIVLPHNIIILKYRDFEKYTMADSHIKYVRYVVLRHNVSHIKYVHYIVLPHNIVML